MLLYTYRHQSNDHLALGHMTMFFVLNSPPCFVSATNIANRVKSKRNYVKIIVDMTTTF